MPRGGARPGAGRKRKPVVPSRISREPLPADAVLKCKPGRKVGQLSNRVKKDTSLGRRAVEGRIHELLKRGDEASKGEAARLGLQLMAFDEPKLQAVMAQTETRVTYVARLPEPILDITEWQAKTAPLLLPKNK
jgi:hypothetical protein